MKYSRAAMCAILSTIVTLPIVNGAESRRDLGKAALSKPPETARPCLGFSTLTMSLQANATDGDAEIFVTAIGQNDGLTSFNVWSPTRRQIASVEAVRNGTGLREFILETAELTDLQRLLTAFPEGTYYFTGRTTTGDCLRGSAPLSHAMSLAPNIVSPSAAATYPRSSFVVSWDAVPQAASYTVELKNIVNGRKFLADLEPALQSFTVPTVWLEPASEYQIVVTATNAAGNANSNELNALTAAE